MAMFKAIAKREDDGSHTIAHIDGLLLISDSQESAQRLYDQISEDQKQSLEIIDIVVSKLENQPE